MRHVGEAGQRGAERLVEQDLPRRVGDVVVAADDVRDPHVDVVDDDAEVVDRRAVGARDDEVVELGVAEDDAALHQIVDDGLAVDGRPEPEDVWLVRPRGGAMQVAAGAIVCRRAARLERGLRDAPRAPRTCTSSGRRDPTASKRSAHSAYRSVALRSGRTAPRPSRGRASASPSRIACDRLLAWSARGRCPRCGARTSRRGGARYSQLKSAVRALPMWR